MRWGGGGWPDIILGIGGVFCLGLSAVQFQPPKKRRHGLGCHLTIHPFGHTAFLVQGCVFL